jgi:predicted ATPase
MRVTIENFKSIRETSIDLRPGLNILIGPNGSGKTCILSALQFLRDIFREGAAQALALQGGARRAYRHGQSKMSFSFVKSYGNRICKRKKIACDLYWEIEIAQAGSEKLATITHEEIRIIGRSGEKDIRLLSIKIDRASGGQAKIKIKLAKQDAFGRDLFSRWQLYKEKNKSALAIQTIKEINYGLSRIKKEPDRSCIPLLIRYDSKLSEINNLFGFLSEYNILPDKARESTEQLPFAQMAPDGRSVSEVIDALGKRRYDKLEQLNHVEIYESYNVGPIYIYPPHINEKMFFRRRRYIPYRSRARGSYEDALDNINQELAAAVKPITHVSVNMDQSNGRRFVVFKTDRNDTFYPQEVSDGTIKWLCILVSLFVPFSKVYLLEEPENFMHPWMQQRLISIMREQARQNETIFFLASHSATILNAALTDEILIVKQGKRGTEVSAISNSQEIKKILADSEFHLGDLWVSGAIGGVPA